MTVSQKNFMKPFMIFYGVTSLTLSEAFQTGKLSISQRRGIISLLPKDENNLMVLSNWRPITLLNVDNKYCLEPSQKEWSPSCLN